MLRQYYFSISTMMSLFQKRAQYVIQHSIFLFGLTSFKIKIELKKNYCALVFVNNLIGVFPFLYEIHQMVVMVT